MKLDFLHNKSLMVFAALAFFGPNALYIYGLIAHPDLNQAAMTNPTALAFMIEAFMLLGLFLWWVYKKTHSWRQVAIYLGLSFMGSLAFSFPLFLYQQRKCR